MDRSFLLLFVLWLCCFDEDTDTARRNIWTQVLILVDCFFYPSAALTKIQIQEREPSGSKYWYWLTVRSIRLLFWQRYRYRKENHRRKYWDWLTVRSIPLLLWRKYRMRTTQTWVRYCLNCSFVLRFVLSLCSFDKDTNGGMRTTRIQVAFDLFVYCSAALKKIRIEQREAPRREYCIWSVPLFTVRSVVTW